ncbi:uncharacterized protein LOC119405157 [Rhipicephalus sanguineus]|uniref:uncharacterized protein LOC119405157 n=1 Tax=Rhipicephalus sanguineus TaxID=34632 RepID=UPI0020C48290|nr:uncharacterized protein LOC119405157 [Rhipicephalus sanguineus]
MAAPRSFCLCSCSRSSKPCLAGGLPFVPSFFVGRELVGFRGGQPQQRVTAARLVASIPFLRHGEREPGTTTEPTARMVRQPWIQVSHAQRPGCQSQRDRW